MAEKAIFDEGIVKPIVLGGRLLGFRIGTDEIRVGSIATAPRIMSRGGKIIVSGGDPEIIKKLRRLVEEKTGVKKSRRGRKPKE